MKLESAEITNFRSIDHVFLDEFGGLNVFIGKNNAGKSNLLSTLYAFFTCLKGGNVVTLNPPIGKEIDFFDKPPHQPIEATLVFSLSNDERTALLADIVLSAPQVRNAVEGLDPELRLMVTLTINPPPTTYGVFSEISLIPPGSKRTDESKNKLLSIPTDAAFEIRSNLAEAEARMTDTRDLSQATRYMDPDDWQAYRGEQATGPVFISQWETEFPC
jgi:hypothetical protein